MLTLPLCRVRQMIELISQRKRAEFKVHARVVEWQTKNLGSLFVALAQDEKQGKALANMVKKMHLPIADDEEDSPVVDDRPIEQVIEEGAKVDPSKLPSFGQMSAFLSNM